MLAKTPIIFGLRKRALSLSSPSIFSVPNRRWSIGIGMLLLLHVVAWVLAHGIADTNLDGYADMLENFAWGQNWAWGSAKHPPLFAWVTGAWFSVFPHLDASYHLLAYLNVAIGLLGVYQAARAMGRPDLAVPSALLLCLAFPYSTLAVKFNANAILLSLWPWVVLAWVRCVASQGRGALFWSLGLGVLSALAMLGKYYSGVFLLAIFISSLASRNGRAWFGTYRPWLTLAVFGACLSTHLLWLQDHDWVTLRYVGEQGGSEGVSWRMVLKFALSPLAYWLLPWVLCAWVYAPGSPTLWQRLRGWPQRLLRAWLPQGWDDTLFWIALLPWAITLAFGISGFVELSMPWAIPIGYGFSLLWLRNLSRHGPDLPAAQTHLMRYFVSWCVLIVAVSPWYAWHQAQEGTPNHYLPRREAAQALLTNWHARYPDQPLRWVGGQWAENALLAFYGDPSLRVVPGVPDQFPATVNPLHNWQQQAGLLLCPLGPIDAPEPSSCPQDMQNWLLTQGQTPEAIELTVVSKGMRFVLDKPFAYIAFAYLPPAP